MFFHKLFKAGFISWSVSIAMKDKGATIFFWREVPNLQKVSVNKIATPLFRQQNFYDTPWPQIHLIP